jgi:DNA-binding Lrp family transcriptional regulator
VVARSSLDSDDLRLVAALQWDGRAASSRLARVLGLNPRVVARRCRVLSGDGLVRVVAVAPRPRTGGVVLLRIRVLRGELDVDPRNRLVFRQLPGTPSRPCGDASPRSARAACS